MEIIKKNEINKKGLLIEYDAGYISPKDNKNFVNEASELTPGRQFIEDPLIVYAVMQKYGTENKNERIWLAGLQPRMCQPMARWESYETGHAQAERIAWEVKVSDDAL